MCNTFSPFFCFFVPCSDEFETHTHPLARDCVTMPRLASQLWGDYLTSSACNQLHVSFPRPLLSPRLSLSLSLEFSFFLSTYGWITGVICLFLLVFSFISFSRTLLLFSSVCLCYRPLASDPSWALMLKCDCQAKNAHLLTVCGQNLLVLVCVHGIVPSPC